jgi:hypothetical protein
MTAVTRPDLKNITDRLESIDQKLQTSDAWSARADERFQGIDERFDRKDAQFDALRREMQDGFAEDHRYFKLLLDELRKTEQILPRRRR